MDIERTLLMGNEAIARGALEGGASYCTGYPGNPSSEIIGNLLLHKNKYELEVEWSVNEIVALEAAAAFSFAGLSALVAMKQNGINVCSDFLTTVCLNELKGGLLVVVCDDPGPLTSTNEEDSRHFAKIAQIPLLEPSTPQEAKDMTSWLLRLSQDMGVVCMLRSVSRLSHCRGGVKLGPIPQQVEEPFFDLQKPLVGLPQLVALNHQALLNKMRKIQNVFEHSAFNSYHGPSKARFLIIAGGLGALYAQEAVETLGLEAVVGVLKIGTLWPLPAAFITRHLYWAESVLFVEEVDPFIEDQVKVLYAEHTEEMGKIIFYGKNTGEVSGPNGPGVGEINADIVLEALRSIFNIEDASSYSSYSELSGKLTSSMLVPRELSFCRGCPHRASFFALNAALKLDGRDGFVIGDIGCYGLAAGETGFNQIKALHCMGSGMGNASGFSKLSSFGFNQPAVAVAGDSTFYHACLPALVNACFNNADVLFVILDNSITAMTGFQESPATPSDFSKENAPVIIENITRGMGVKTTVLDPLENIQEAIELIFNQLQEGGVKLVVFRRACATYEEKSLPVTSFARVEETKCVGESCGCDRFCIRVLGCPAVEYDYNKQKAYIIEDSCNGCGLCVKLCPKEAISLLEKGDMSCDY